MIFLLQKKYFHFLIEVFIKNSFIAKIFSSLITFGVIIKTCLNKSGKNIN